MIKMFSRSSVGQSSIARHCSCPLSLRFLVKVKGKGRYSSSWEPHLRTSGRHLPYGITQFYLPTYHPTQVNTPRQNPSHAGWYSIYLFRRDVRLSFPSWLDSAPAASQPATFRSRVRRRTAAPPRQPPVSS